MTGNNTTPLSQAENMAVKLANSGVGGHSGRFLMEAVQKELNGEHFKSMALIANAKREAERLRSERAQQVIEQVDGILDASRQEIVEATLKSKLTV